jgi:type II secretory pathway pseudopilin PulG
VKLHWTEWLVVTAIVGVACTAVYAGLMRAMRRAVGEKQRETERQLGAMAATVQALQARVAELGGQEALRALPSERAATFNATENAGGPKQESPEPEIVAVLTAAASTFLGKKAHVRSAQVTPAERSSAGAWAQQGRAFVQTSHNPRSRG